jgi:hypothetical protein
MNERGYLETWRGVPRAEMLGRVIVVLDGVRHRAAGEGDHHYVAYVDNALLPFLEHELQEAEKAEE